MSKTFYLVGLIVVVSVVAIVFVGGGASPAEMKKHIADKCKQDGVDYNPGPFYSDSVLIKYAPDKRYQLRDFSS